MLGVYTRWLNDWALLIGWAAGIATGTAMFVAAKLAPTYPLAVDAFTFPSYAALYAVIVNLILPPGAVHPAEAIMWEMAAFPPCSSSERSASS